MTNILEAPLSFEEAVKFLGRAACPAHQQDHRGYIAAITGSNSYIEIAIALCPLAHEGRQLIAKDLNNFGPKEIATFGNTKLPSWWVKIPGYQVILL